MVVIKEINKIELARKIMHRMAMGIEWATSVPADLDDFFDNPYVESLMDVLEEFKELVFTESEIEAINWFCYTWASTKEPLSFQGEMYTFKDANEYVKFLIEKEGWTR